MQYKGKICNIFLLFLVTQYGIVAGASPLVMPGDRGEQRQKARQEAQQRQERADQQDVFLKQEAGGEEALPVEAIQFQIQEIGSVAGLRCSLGKNSQYEIFAGWALKKPEGMQEGKPVYGFQYISQI